MIPARGRTSVEAWLQWFEASKYAQCRAYLCTAYRFDAVDAEALINTARLQVFLHWATLENPLAYFWQTLKHAAGKQRQRCVYERRQLAVYAWQRRVNDAGAERTAGHVSDVLAQVSPGQHHLLEWYTQGFDDTQVAAWLQTTPQVVRVQRHRLICTLRVQSYPSGRHRYARRRGGK